MKHRVLAFLLKYETVLVLFIIVALAVSIQSYLLPARMVDGVPWKDYNNYIIFKNSFFHLFNHQNLYIQYQNEQNDIFKYSPVFAMFMALFAYLPDFLGLTLWNLINAFALFFAVWRLPYNTNKRSMLSLFVLLELLGSLQNSQSNGLMAGLIISAFCMMQQNHSFRASLLIVIATFIKIYGGLGFLLFLFFRHKVNFITYCVLLTILFLCLPLLVMPYHTLIWQYQNWLAMLKSDHSASYGLSIMGWLHSWFGVTDKKNLITAVGIILLLIPFLRYKMYKCMNYRLLVLASLLIWIVIFNHKAEPPTYIIAIAGAGIWFFTTEQHNWKKIFLLLFFIITCLTQTDLFPNYLKTNFFAPYSIKALPSIILWTIIQYELLSKNRKHKSATVA